MTLGEFIRNYRDEHNLSQRELARKCNLSNAQISLLERGLGTKKEPFKPNYVTIGKVARGMGMSTDALIASCDDFLLDISDSTDEMPVVKQFIEQQAQRSPDEEILLMTYRLIPVEHRAEVLQAALQVKMKYEN